MTFSSRIPFVSLLVYGFYRRVRFYHRWEWARKAHGVHLWLSFVRYIMFAGRSGACLSLRVDVFYYCHCSLQRRNLALRESSYDVMLSSQATEINTYFRHYASLNLVNVTRCYGLTRERCESCEGHEWGLDKITNSAEDLLPSMGKFHTNADLRNLSALRPISFRHDIR